MTDTRSDIEVRTFIHGMWANVAGAWAANADDVDARGAELTMRMLDAVDLRRGDRVLELASGPGGVGLAAAEVVGTDGEVVVSDVVADMVDIAALRATERGLTNVKAAVLDLEAIAQPDQTYDVVVCREGLMFALDPANAALEMHRVLRPTGRVAISVWAAREDNPWLGLFLDAIAEVTGIVVPRPGMPGPFALSDADALKQLFAEAGFIDIQLDSVSVPLRSPSFAAWWNRNLTVAGPIVGIVAGLDDDTRTRLQDAVRVTVAPYETDGTLDLPGLVSLVTGRRP